MQHWLSLGSLKWFIGKGNESDHLHDTIMSGMGPDWLNNTPRTTVATKDPKNKTIDLLKWIHSGLCKVHGKQDSRRNGQTQIIGQPGEILMLEQESFFQYLKQVMAFMKSKENYWVLVKELDDNACHIITELCKCMGLSGCLPSRTFVYWSIVENG